MQIPHGSSRRFGPYDIAVPVLGLFIGWSLAGAHDFQGAWLVVAVILTVGFLVGFLRRLFRI